MMDTQEYVHDQLERKYIALRDAAIKLRAAQLAYLEVRGRSNVPEPERVRRYRAMEAAGEQMDVLLLK